ncbi:hypothetical protein CY35_02G007900 [Sphagnum magellanicum]|nr:hypothetical protein CY35_02G007900 [Sphagnum magellanicum]KAH9569761.1 hypothetical protein CY35_02G007900 [Sphagnum magellanicum]
MGLCASRALGELTELEEEEVGHDEDCRSCLQIDHQSGAGDGGGGGGGDGVQMTSRSCSSSSSRRSNNSGNSSSLVKAALSFDSSRSSAEVGDMGKLGALFCKRRPFVGSPDILSLHLTNLLSSLVRSSSSVMDHPQQELQLLANAAEISFSSYLSKSFIRPQAAAAAAAGFQQEHASAAGTRDSAALDAIAKSYAESAAKAAARDTLLFLKENDTLQGYALTSCCVPEELDDSKGLDPEEAEEEEEEKATSETTHQTVDLFRPGGLQYQQTEKELAVGDVVAAQRSLFEFCFPATSTSSRWASVVNAARQSACLAATFRPLQQQLQAGSSVQGDVVLEQKLEGKQQQQKKKTLEDLVPPLQDAAAYSSKLDQNLLGAADAAGAKVMCRSDDEDSRDQRGCLVSCPTSCCSCLQIGSMPSPGKKCSESQCNSSSSTCDSPSLEDHHHHQEGKLEEDDSAQDDPADLADRDSFFSFPSSPSSKLFEEMGSGHIIEQMKFTKLMQEIACQRKIVEEFHAGILQNFEDKPRSSSCQPAAETPPPSFSSRPSGNGFQGSECAASQQLLTHEEDSRVAPQQQQQSGFHNNKNLNLFAIQHQQDCSTNTCHAVGAPAVSTNRFAGLELLANTEEDDEDEDDDDDEDDDSSDTHAREYGEHDGDDNESSCESFNIDEDHAQGMRIMSLMGILRNLVHGGKAVQKVSSTPKSLKKDAAPNMNKSKTLEQQLEDSTATTMTTTLSSTVKGLVILKRGLLCRNHLAVKSNNIAHKSISP